MVVLTPSERKLLGELALGFTNVHIAERLSYTKDSVDVLTTRLYDKLEIVKDDSLNRRSVAIKIFYKGEYTSGAEA